MAPPSFLQSTQGKLTANGFEQKPDIDPCLFIHKKAMCVTYVDDCIWVSLDEKALDTLIEKESLSLSETG